MPTDTFNPDADPETSTVDGEIRRENNENTWAQIRENAGTSAFPGTDAAGVELRCDANTDNTYNRLKRFFFLFDTSSIPSDAVINSASVKLFCTSTSTALQNFSVDIVSASPASNTNLVTGDYNSLGTTLLSNSIAFGSLSTSAYNTFTLNASGLAAITKGGITKLAARFDNDRTDSDPGGCTAGTLSNALFQTADGANPPILTVDYTAEGKKHTLLLGVG